MPKERSEIEAGLSNKGFRLEDKDHRYWIYWTEEGTKTPVRTMTSHGSKYKTLDDSLVAKMAKQCKLPKGQFIDLVNCPLSRTDFEKLLSDGGHI